METQFRKAYNVITDEEGNKTIVYPVTTADVVKIETSNIEDQPLDLQKFFNKIKNAAYRDIGEIIDTKSMDIDFSNGGTERTYNKSAINKGFKDIKTTVETIEKTVASFEKDISNVENTSKIITNFLNRQGESLTGGIVLRRFEDLKKNGYHEKNGMPLSEEYRVFIYAGQEYY